MARETTVAKASLAVAQFGKGFNQFAAQLMREAGDELVEYIRRKKFKRRGQPGPDYIVNRSGALSRSLRATVSLRGKNITLSVQMSGPQARILEEGGKTGAHLIFPRRARVLSFYWKKLGKRVAFAYVHHPGSRFDARKVLASSIAERGTDIIRTVEKEMLAEWERRLEGSA